MRSPRPLKRWIASSALSFALGCAGLVGSPGGPLPDGGLSLPDGGSAQGGAMDGGARGPSVLPVISRGVPIYSSGDASPASNANDGDYGTLWTSSAAPSTSAPVWLALDLSGVPAAQRGLVVVVWYSDPGSSHYDFSLNVDGQTPAMPGLYRIDAHAGPGGGAPPAPDDPGWTPLTQVTTENVYHSRQHGVSLTQGGTVYNWVRLYVTEANSPGVPISLNLDVHDAAAGLEDDWIFYGDSITEMSMSHDPKATACPSPCPYGSPGTFAQLVQSAEPTHFPVQENGGTGYLHAYDGAAHIQTWLALFPGRYVGLSYGTNDAWNSSPCDQSCSDAFYQSYVTLVTAVIDAGKVPIVPTIPWSRLSYIQTNAPILNQRIRDLYAAYPQVVPGPDLYAFFENNQALINTTDNVHPTAEGQLAYRNLWVQTLLQSIYARAP